MAKKQTITPPGLGMLVHLGLHSVSFAAVVGDSIRFAAPLQVKTKPWSGPKQALVLSRPSLGSCETKPWFWEHIGLGSALVAR